MNWPRVNRQRPCSICGKPDWCTWNDNGSGCMRVESPVQMRNGGWWHPNNLSGQANESARHFPDTDSHRDWQPTQSLLDCDALLSHWRQSQNGQLEPFAATLGVSQDALRSLGCVWSSEHRAFAFPMVDAQRRVIGIRLRNERGEKWAVKGSRSGLFMNLSGGVVACVQETGIQCREKLTGHNRKSLTREESPAQILIVEGPTDAAAAIDLGFSVVGRPACLGCEEMIASVVAKHGHVTTLIIADSDSRECPNCHGDGCNQCQHTGILEPGQRGAAKLQEKLRKAKIVTLPCKDLREFVQLGGTKELLNEILNAGV